MSRFFAVEILLYGSDVQLYNEKAFQNNRTQKCAVLKASVDVNISYY